MSCPETFANFWVSQQNPHCVFDQPPRQVVEARCAHVRRVVEWAKEFGRRHVHHNLLFASFHNLGGQTHSRALIVGLGTPLHDGVKHIRVVVQGHLVVAKPVHLIELVGSL